MRDLNCRCKELPSCFPVVEHEMQCRLKAGSSRGFEVHVNRKRDIHIWHGFQAGDEVSSWKYTVGIVSFPTGYSDHDIRGPAIT